MVAVACGSARPFVSLPCVACACGSNNYLAFLFVSEEDPLFLFTKQTGKNEILAAPNVPPTIHSSINTKTTHMLQVAPQARASASMMVAVEASHGVRPKPTVSVRSKPLVHQTSSVHTTAGQYHGACLAPPSTNPGIAMTALSNLRPRNTS